MASEVKFDLLAKFKEQRKDGPNGGYFVLVRVLFLLPARLAWWWYNLTTGKKFWHLVPRWLNWTLLQNLFSIFQCIWQILILICAGPVWRFFALIWPNLAKLRNSFGYLDFWDLATLPYLFSISHCTASASAAVAVFMYFSLCSRSESNFLTLVDNALTSPSTRRSCERIMLCSSFCMIFNFMVVSEPNMAEPKASPG